MLANFQYTDTDARMHGWTHWTAWEQNTSGG